MNLPARRAIHMNRTTIVILGRAVIASALIAAGLDRARAEEAPAATTPNAGAVRPSVVPSPKGDGSQMNPMRRTQSVDRQKAANSAAERKNASEAAGVKAAAPRG
jgi:hypothetical protein